MLSLKLMSEVSRRIPADRRVPRTLLDDACVQAAYCLDAPHTVEDGVEWFEDPDFADVRGPVPRIVEVREPANVQFTGCRRQSGATAG